MKVTLGLLHNSIETIKKMAELDLSISVAFVLFENMQKIEKHIEFYSKKITSVIEKYAVKEDGKVKFLDDAIQLQPDKKNEAYQELLQIEQFEVDLDLTLISLSELKNELLKTKGIQMKANELFQISYMMKD